jgi:hypothetical protein
VLHGIVMRSHDDAVRRDDVRLIGARARSLWLERHSALEIQKIVEAGLQPQDVWFISPLLR